MSHEQKISLARPGLIVLLLDDSTSMTEFLLGTTDPKYAWVQKYVSIILDDLLASSSEAKGDAVVIKPRFYVRVIKYGSTVEDWGSGEMDIQTAIRLYSTGANSLGLGGRLGGTDTKQAFQHVNNRLQESLQTGRFKDSFPPLVFHLTDGESQTDPRPEVEKTMALSTNDGNVLVANAYIGTRTSLNYQGPQDFPGYVEVSEVGPSKDNIHLFEMSSKTPDSIIPNLRVDGVFPQIRCGARLFFDVRTREMLKHAIQVVSSVVPCRVRG